jgi:inositol-hexakisphosphate/diphosphoinositol-pentakisphosphate 1-kinase
MISFWFNYFARKLLQSGDEESRIEEENDFATGEDNIDGFFKVTMAMLNFCNKTATNFPLFPS